MPLFRGQWVDDLDEAQRRYEAQVAAEQADAEATGESTSNAGADEPKTRRKRRTAAELAALRAAENPDPDGDRIGDGQGPFSSDERDIQEAEQERVKLARKLAGVEPHEDEGLEQEARDTAVETAPDGLRDHTGTTGSPADPTTLADLISLGAEAPAAQAEADAADVEPTADAESATSAADTDGAQPAEPESTPANTTDADKRRAAKAIKGPDGPTESGNINPSPTNGSAPN